MKKLLTFFLLLVLLLTSCSTAGGEETSGAPDTTAPDTSEALSSEVTTGSLESWYLTKRMELAPPIVEIPEKCEALVVRAPLVTEGEENGIRYKIEFFRDGYEMGSLIQVRITLTNLNPVVGVNPSYPGGVGTAYFESRSDENRSWENPLPMNEEEKILLQQGTLSYQVTAEIFNRENYNRQFPLDEIKYGESHVLERVFLADPSFFCEPRAYTFTVTLEPFSENVEFSVTIPVEIVMQKD